MSIHDSDKYRYFDEGASGSSDIMCGVCETEGLHREDHGTGFRLYDEENKLHICHRPDADAFEDVS